MGKVGTPSSQVLAIRWVLLHFSVLWKIDGESHAFPIWWNINGNRMGNHMGKKHPYYGKSMSTNFPVHPMRWVFVTFFRTMRNWWGNPCISHITKYIIEWESMRKKHPYYGKSMSINLPGFPHTMGFAAFSRTVENLCGNPCIPHMMTLVNFFLWERNIGKGKINKSR